MEREKKGTSTPELTSEELSIVDLLAQGLTDDAIARRLGLAKRTYRRRLDNLLAELGARSRFQAGAMAVQRGWIKEPITGRSDDPY
ncbi:MAG TPA: LuxR C-terminal-related transcriptional regulator [Actinomycetota bacterium]|nr:LuxR C-terminal-related transcriptional regulator [Actinomycetota bacterium]